MDPINVSSALPSTAPLTADQQAALKKLHDAAVQLEGVFVGMLFKEMHSTVPEDSIFGKESNADHTWQDMLDEKESDSIAKTGSFGIAKIVEQQLRAQVLANPGVDPMSGKLPAQGLPSQQLPSTGADPLKDNQ